MLSQCWGVDSPAHLWECVFVPTKFMFADVERTFSDVKHMFTDGKHTFTVGKHTFSIGEHRLHRVDGRTFPQGNQKDMPQETHTAWQDTRRPSLAGKKFLRCLK